MIMPTRTSSAQSYPGHTIKLEAILSRHSRNKAIQLYMYMYMYMYMTVFCSIQ